MKAGVQEIIRIELDAETVETLQDEGATVHFPLNDENTKLIELVRVDSDRESESDSDDYRGVA